MLKRKLDAALPDPAPHLRIETTNLTDIVFHVPVFCPTDRALELEQAIMADIMALYGDTEPPVRAVSAHL